MIDFKFSFLLVFLFFADKVSTTRSLDGFQKTYGTKKIIASSVAPGFDTTNATACFVNAITSAKKGDTVVIDCKPGTDGVWNIAARHPNWFDGRNGANKVAENLTLIFEEGVTLKAIDSTYNHESGLDMLLRLENISGWNIYGYGAKFEMQKNTLPEGEFRNAIALYDCSDITIEGLAVDGSGGDGITIGTRTPTGFSKQITVKNMSFSNHRRQGLTITSAQDVLFENVSFSGTTGRAPSAGIDLEPDYVTQRLVNIQFENIALTGNGYSGMLLALSKLNDTSMPISIVSDGVYVRDNWQQDVLDPAYKKAALALGLGGGPSNAVQGSVSFKNVLVKNEKFDALYTLKHHDSYSLTFKDLVIQNVGLSKAADAQFAIHTSRFNYDSPNPAVGKISFNGLLVSDKRSVPFWQMEGDSDDGWSIEDVIIDKALIVTLASKGKEINNTTKAVGGEGTVMNYNIVKSIPKNTVTLATSDTLVQRGKATTFIVKRSANNSGYPLPVEYKLSGTAENGNDYDLLHGHVIIPSNQEFVEIPLRCRLKEDVEETVVMSIQQTQNYSLGITTEQEIILKASE